MGKFEEFLKLAKLLDEATINQDALKLSGLIDQIEQDVEKFDIFNRAAMYYSLATATCDLWKIEHKDGDGDCDKDSIQKQLYFYRKAIALFDEKVFKERFDGYAISLIANSYINYGNTLEACGRKLSAIEQYYKALSIYPNHPMALGNLGSALLHYSMFLSPNKSYVRDCINFYAAHMLTDAIISNDGNIYDEAKEYFKSRLNTLTVEYKAFLQKGIKFTKRKKMSKKERLYRQWCIHNGLYLSPLSDLPCEDLSFAVDEMCLPGIITPIDQGMPIIIGMYNQVKEEYISARYMYYETLQFETKPHFSDKLTGITDTLEYALFSLRVEKLKSSFKTLYGILDKVAYFLNAYFDLGIEPLDVDFKSVWHSKKFGKNGYEYKNTLDTSNNFALSSLYWIQREFEKSDEKYASPKLKRLKIVRNFLEHKYTIVTMFAEKASQNEENDTALYICEKELYDLTFELLKLVREAIICLALCVSVEEIKKADRLGFDADFIHEVPMVIREIDDDLKI